MQMNERELLEMALIGFERQRGQIAAQIADVQRELATRLFIVVCPDAATGQGKAQQSTVNPATAKVGVKRSHKNDRLFEAGRRAIVRAQRKRWAVVKKAKPAHHTPDRLSDAGRRAIIAANRRRWAAHAAAQKGKQERKAAR